MYPARELSRLAAGKAALRQDIALRRAECAEAAARAAKPLESLDRLLAFWRRLSPLVKIAAVPLGFMVKKAVFPRRKILRSLVRWGPLVYGAVRGIRATAKSRSGSS